MPVSTSTFTLQIDEAELALLREALHITIAIKSAQGDDNAAAAMRALGLRVQGLPAAQGDKQEGAFSHATIGGNVHNIRVY